MTKTNPNRWNKIEKELLEESEAHSQPQGASTSPQKQQGASTSPPSTSPPHVESTSKQHLEKWFDNCVNFISEHPEVAYKVMSKGFGGGPVGRIINIFKRNPEKKMERDWANEIAQYYQNNNTRPEALKMIQLGHTKRILAIEKDEQKINEIKNNLLMSQQVHFVIKI